MRYKLVTFTFKLDRGSLLFTDSRAVIYVGKGVILH